MTQDETKAQREKLTSTAVDAVVTRLTKRDVSFLNDDQTRAVADFLVKDGQDARHMALALGELIELARKRAMNHSFFESRRAGVLDELQMIFARRYKNEALPLHLLRGGDSYLDRQVLNQFQKEAGVVLESKDGHPYYRSDLFLSDVRLRELPESLEVDGSLTLRNCDITYGLPEHLTVHGDLDIDKSNSLHAPLPTSLVVDGTIRGLDEGVMRHYYNRLEERRLVDILEGFAEDADSRLAGVREHLPWHPACFRLPEPYVVKQPDYNRTYTHVFVGRPAGNMGSYGLCLTADGTNDRNLLSAASGHPEALLEQVDRLVRNLQQLKDGRVVSANVVQLDELSVDIARSVVDLARNPHTRFFSDSQQALFERFAALAGGRDSGLFQMCYDRVVDQAKRLMDLDVIHTPWQRSALAELEKLARGEERYENRGLHR